MLVVRHSRGALNLSRLLFNELVRKLPADQIVLLLDRSQVVAMLGVLARTGGARRQAPHCSDRFAGLWAPASHFLERIAACTKSDLLNLSAAVSSCRCAATASPMDTAEVLQQTSSSVPGSEVVSRRRLNRPPIPPWTPTKELPKRRFLPTRMGFLMEASQSKNLVFVVTRPQVNGIEITAGRVRFAHPLAWAEPSLGSVMTSGAGTRADSCRS